MILPVAHLDVITVEHLRVKVVDAVVAAQVQVQVVGHGVAGNAVVAAQAQRHLLGALVAGARGVLVAVLGLVGAVQLADLVGHCGWGSALCGASVCASGLPGLELLLI